VHRASQRRRRRRRNARKEREETVLPTPERIAKGNVVRLESGQIKSVNATFLDVMSRDELFTSLDDWADLHLSLAFMLDLTERSGLFSSATRSISELSFVRGGSNADMSAADEWRHILKSLTPDAKRTVIDIYSDTRARSSVFLLHKLIHFRELNRVVMSFRLGQFRLTKPEDLTKISIVGEGEVRPDFGDYRGYSGRR